MRSMNNFNSLVINYLKRVSYRINYTTPSYLWSWWNSNHQFHRLSKTIFFIVYQLFVIVDDTTKFHCGTL